MAQKIEEEKEESKRDQLTAAAFNAWLNGNGGKKNWMEYQRSLGLVEKKEKMSDKQRQAEIDRAHKIAERIMSMDKKGKK